MKKYLAGNIKGCQKKVSQLLVDLKLTYFRNSKIVVGNLLKQYQASFSHGNIVHSFIVYKLDIWSLDLIAYFKLKDLEDYLELLHLRMSILTNIFNLNRNWVQVNCFLIPTFDWVNYGNIFGVDNSWSTHTDNRINDISVLGEGPTQHLGNITITAQAKYPINFTNQKNKFCLSLHYNGTNRFLHVNDVKIYQFKAKDSEI